MEEEESEQQCVDVRSEQGQVEDNGTCQLQQVWDQRVEQKLKCTESQKQ